MARRCTTAARSVNIFIGSRRRVSSPKSPFETALYQVRIQFITLTVIRWKQYKRLPPRSTEGADRKCVKAILHHAKSTIRYFEGDEALIFGVSVSLVLGPWARTAAFTRTRRSAQHRQCCSVFSRLEFRAAAVWKPSKKSKASRRRSLQSSWPLPNHAERPTIRR